MLINSKEADKRLNSTQNLINKLRSSNGRSKAMQLFGIGNGNNKPVIVSPFEKKPAAVMPEKATETATFAKQLPASQEVTAEEVMPDADDKIKMELIRSAATDTLLESVKQLKIQIPAMDNASKLADVASKMSRIVSDLETKRNDRKSGDETIHYHFYMPEQRKIEQYEVIEVS